MPEGGVEDAPCAVGTHPGEGEVAVGAVHSGGGEIDGGGVEAHEDPHTVGGVGRAELVDLVGDVHLGGKMRGGGKIRVHQDPGFEGAPRVAVEVCADHVAVLGPVVEGVGGAVA